MKMLTTAILLAFAMLSVNAQAGQKMTKEQRAKIIKEMKEHAEKMRRGKL